MLTLTGVVRAALQVGGGVNRKTGEVIPTRSVVQLEGQDHRGLVALFTLTVPDHTQFATQQGQTVSLPVRAWAEGGKGVNFVYEAR